MTPSILFKRLFSAQNLPLLLAFLLLISTTLIKPISLQRPVYAFQIGFDISQSMNVIDVSLDGEPVTRLMYAKSMAITLLQQLPCGSRVGWSVFTGRRTLTLITPLEVCSHYSGLLASLAEVDGSMRWTNGSSIGKGIHQIMRAADEFAEPASIIFMTDGQEAPPLEQGQRGVPNTDKFLIEGLLVGVGGETPMPIPKSNANGETEGYWQAEDVVQRVNTDLTSIGEEFSRRDDERLTSLARYTGLAYITLDSSQSLVDQSMNARHAQYRRTLTDIRWIPATAALLILIFRYLPNPRDMKAGIKFGRTMMSR